MTFLVFFAYHKRKRNDLSMANVNIDINKLPQYLDDIAKKQLPFACALTLTHTAGRFGQAFAKMASRSFKTTTPFAQRYKSASKSGHVNPGYSWFSTIAKKEHGLDLMCAVVGNQHWGIAEQVGNTSTIRKTTSKAKYRWIPVHGKRSKNKGPGTFLDGKKKGVFVMKTQKGKTFIVSRAGKSRKITPLFMRRKQQTIKPKFNMQSFVDKYAEKYFNLFFDKDMDYALRTRKK